ncbi:MAG: glycosyltransferase family 61 protein [Brumimicrobium sp.]
MAPFKKIKKFPPAHQNFDFPEGDNDPPISEDIEVWEITNALVTMYGYVLKNGKNIDFFTSPRHRGSIGLKTIFASYLLKEKIKIKGTVVSFTHGWYDNYYHFVTECLPKLYVLKDYLNDSTVAFPKELKRFHKEYLSVLEIKNIVYIDKNQVIVADKVVSCNFMNRDLNHHPVITPQFRDWIISKVTLNESNHLPTHFFINREKAAHRKIINNEEVKSHLVNLKNINLEGYSVLDQIKLFNQAEEIQAVHGASLSNLIFCQKDTKIKEYIHKEFKQHCFNKLSKTLDLNYTKIECEGNQVHSLPGYCDIIIPIKSLNE